MLVEVARAKFVSVQHTESLSLLAIRVTLGGSTSKHSEIAGDPLEHVRKEVRAHQSGQHQLGAQLLATATNMKNIGGNNEIAELGVFLGGAKDHHQESRAKYRSKVAESVLDGVGGLILEILNVVFFA